MSLIISNISNIYNIQNIKQLIAECPPQFFEILLDFLNFVINYPGFNIQNLLDFNLIFQPLIAIARQSFFDNPQNIYGLVLFFINFISNHNFYAFFLQTPCIEMPFDVISLIFSDAAHNISEQEREHFDTSLISNCILLIGDFFNFDLIIKQPQLQISITQLLYNIKCSKRIISYSAVIGTIKALKISPKITINTIFKENIFPDLISLLLQDENNNEALDQSMENKLDIKNEKCMHQENVQIEVLNLINLIIKFDENKLHFVQIVSVISDALHIQMQKSEPYKIKTLQILLTLSQISNQDEQKLLTSLQATNDSIQFILTDLSFNLKCLSFQYITSLMKFPNYQFFKERLFVFEFINQFICSLSNDDLLIFIRLMKKLLILFNQRNDASLRSFLIQIGFVEELSSLTINYDVNEINEIYETCNIISFTQGNNNQ